MLLFALVLISLTHARLAFSFTGDLTTYADALSGPAAAAGYACGIADIPHSHAQQYFTAIGDVHYQSGVACGRCLRASGPTTVEVVLFVVDRCGECLDGALDTSLPAYSLLTDEPPGRRSVLWEWVPCDFITGNVRVKQQDGSTEWWMGLQILDSVTPVDAVTIGGTPLERSSYGYWHPKGVSPIDRTCVIHSGSQTITLTLNPYGSTEIQDTGKQFATSSTPTTAPTEPARTIAPTNTPTVTSTAPTSTPTVTSTESTSTPTTAQAPEPTTVQNESLKPILPYRNKNMPKAGVPCGEVIV